MRELMTRQSGATWMATGTLMAGLVVLSGCVMSEKYEAEKARSLNFQRLLAQEEKRSAELDSEVKRTKRELAEYEARNRELSAQVEAVRQQAAQIQEEAQAMKEASFLEKKAQDEMRRLTTVPSKGKKSDKSSKSEKKAKSDSSISALDLQDDLASDVLDFKSESLDKGKSTFDDMDIGMGTSGMESMTHTVKPGDTLYRIGQRYHVSVDNLRKWNNLAKDTIEVGQKLIVSQP